MENERENTREKREQIVKESIFSVELEGLKISQEQLDIFNDYIDGKISISEMVEKTKAKYG